MKRKQPKGREDVLPKEGYFWSEWYQRYYPNSTPRLSNGEPNLVGKERTP